MSEALLRAVPSEVEEAHEPVDRARLARVVGDNHAFVWRSLRRLGVLEPDVDDAVQKVFLVAADRLGGVPPHLERSFLFGTAVRVASNERRAQGRRRATGTDDLDVYANDAPSPEQAAADRALLDRLLDPLSLELRSVFILFELEQLTIQEIAALLEIPVGTAASRLRRARELVNATIARLRAREEGTGR